MAMEAFPDRIQRVVDGQRPSICSGARVTYQAVNVHGEPLQRVGGGERLGMGCSASAVEIAAAKSQLKMRHASLDGPGGQRPNPMQ